MRVLRNWMKNADRKLTWEMKNRNEKMVTEKTLYIWVVLYCVRLTAHGSRLTVCGKCGVTSDVEIFHWSVERVAPRCEYVETVYTKCVLRCRSTSTSRT